MIELYAKGTTDFSARGIALAAQQAAVTYQENGRFDMDLTMPYDGRITIDYGMILRCPVPVQEVGTITLGTVSYWKVSAGETDVKLYSEVPTLRKITYKPWVYSQPSSTQAIYSVGDKVTYNGQNYRCTAYDPASPMVQVPPSSNTSWWTQIPNTTGSAGKVASTLQAGDMVVRTGDYNDEYMRASDTAGNDGFIEIAKCTDMSETGTRTVPGFRIEKQSFVITEIEKSSNGKTVTLHAEHISYQLGRTMLGDCNISRANPATALMFIRGAMKEAYPGAIETNLTDEDALITGDFGWKNAQSAILDPKSGFLQATNALIIRNDLDVYILRQGEENPRYRITYGTNLKAVKWDGNVGELVTRVYPIAQNEDGSTLLLPEEYIDTARTVPYIRPESLKTGLKIGATEKQEDGSEITLDEATVYARMREAARNRFNIDEADKTTITLEVDWQHLPETEEYKQFAVLANAAPGEWVQVVNGPMGISQVIRLTGYTYDPILERYTKGNFGKKTQSPGVASYDIQSGAVTGRAIASGAVGSGNIQAGAITAREIEANSITSDRIASRSITTEILAANSVTADEINAGSVTAEKVAANAITAEKIAAGAITAVHISAGAIEADAIGAGVIQAVHIASEAITTDKLAANAITAGKIAALAITTDKLAAGAVTADKIGAGSITAGKIDTNDLSAIQATLEIADIASATIASADIDYAKVKDLTAGSAYFGQAVIQAGLANKLYVPRLAVGYAQMIGATISDLVVQASNGNFYGIDVDLAGNVIATQRTVTQEEISSGHTTDGRQLVLGTDILAEDLNTNNLTASHALMYSITANIIDVDQLWAREAFINKLMVQDISSNTYIQSTIGDWSGSSTITQTINGLDSRISELGYGTVYMQPDEPDHAELVSGDIWIQTMANGSWQDVYNDFASWQEIYDTVSTWQVLGAVPIMWVWDGRHWQEMYDALLPTTVQTEIEQLSTAITLKANQSAVDILSGEVSDFSAQLTIQAQEIEAAVSAVNAKAASYVMWADPRTVYTITLGDIWIKRDTEGFNDTSTWQDVYDNFASWNALYNMHDSWGDMLGDRTFIWNGSAWVETSDRASEIYQKTLIDQTSTQVAIIAETTATLGDDVVSLSANLTVANDRITTEVQRATAAENGKISKTTTLQTADAIVTEAVSQAVSSTSGLYIAKTTSYQDANSIVTEAVRQSASSASGLYIAKTTSYQDATSIVNEAVRQSGQNSIARTQSLQTADAIVTSAVNTAAQSAANLYIKQTTNYKNVSSILGYADTKAAAAETAAKNASIAKTATYQDASAIVSAAGAYTDGQLTNYSTTTQTAETIAAYVGENAYGKVSGITITSSGVDISGSQYVKIASGGYFRVTSGNFGIKSDAGANEYAIWSGASTAASSPFRVKKNGEVYLTKLIAVGEGGTESEVNLRTAGLWKLNYKTVKSASVVGGYCSAMTFSDGTTVNFNRAASVTLSGSWGGSSDPSYTVTATNGQTNNSGQVQVTRINPGGVPAKNVRVRVTGGSSILFDKNIDATSVYNDGFAAVGFKSTGGWSGGSRTITLDNDEVLTVDMPASGTFTKGSQYGSIVQVNFTAGGKTYSGTISI